ncbi:hypothetical protein J1G42_02685 [Cellulomonas sp. zg-ZUI222]|uniref:Uncharacterized protein n=1 Tax=Cellulomonas wangleii TaxID=2816956 RepID=A0ABX8D3Y7_9CELL|nr:MULTISPECIES: hypothetical protein [Cellulomonas]MBO0898869.1 hypothetical protein [Cellulomonas sp. zg-ZUI22]MBO0919731.1 hypothetical protein [Cellulomonas wangleii]MBO0923842.1 hypothetical protein [Cellulomonas wangleii]MBO0924124.1 hypothetical protein [Cellulomonas wangleii]QVI62149.1 hypothetical protein KG103_17320 [Cellulomonas wangleii]
MTGPDAFTDTAFTDTLLTAADTVPADRAPAAADPAGAPGRPLRVALWTLLLVAVVGNLVTSTAGWIAVSISLGVLVLVLVGALVVEHRRMGP